jgi:hypothetical protein
MLEIVSPEEALPMLAVEFATRQNWEIKQQTIIGS